MMCQAARQLSRTLAAIVPLLCLSAPPPSNLPTPPSNPVQPMKGVYLVTRDDGTTNAFARENIKSGDELGTIGGRVLETEDEADKGAVLYYIDMMGGNMVQVCYGWGLRRCPGAERCFKPVS